MRDNVAWRVVPEVGSAPWLPVTALPCSVSVLRCCCFGPVGPVLWLIVACSHFCKPKEVRENLPLEGQVACVSLVTAIVTTVLTAGS